MSRTQDLEKPGLAEAVVDRMHVGGWRRRRRRRQRDKNDERRQKVGRQHHRREVRWRLPKPSRVQQVLENVIDRISIEPIIGEICFNMTQIDIRDEKMNLGCDGIKNSVLFNKTYPSDINTIVNLKIPQNLT